MTGIDLALGLRLAQHLLDAITTGLEDRAQFLPHLRIFPRHLGREQPEHAAALKTAVEQPFRQEAKMILQPLQRLNGIRSRR